MLTENEDLDVYAELHRFSEPSLETFIMIGIPTYFVGLQCSLQKFTMDLTSKF